MDIKDISFYPNPVTVDSKITTNYTVCNTGDTVDMYMGNFTFFDSNKEYYGDFEISQMTLSPGESKDLFHDYFIRVNSPNGLYWYCWTLNVIGKNIKKTTFPVAGFYVNFP